ncbi:ABC transporter substrate-binding protein [Caballeronia sp. dw_19]|uniref:ABC transporter substrate-binding protein n=1 Tax=Caballeronia sp. dw_19 TaxID=2719791 RepID=UPI001BCC7C76|nr:ABC transporter substrate-binding protein [Caballeronia sp. dw_19]
MNTWKFKPLFFASFAFVSLAALNAPLSQAAQSPAGLLIYCSEASPAGFDPGQYTSTVDNAAGAYPIYNRLVEFVRGTTQVTPALATSWDVSPDGLQYTFHLRHGVKFQTTDWFKPSRDFNADDVLFTFNRMRDSNLAFGRAYPVEFPYFTDMALDKTIDRVEALDPYTVRFTLHTASAPFVQNIAMPFASILSAQYAEQLLKAGKAAQINQLPVGTGPFALQSYTKDATIRYKANLDYWNPGVVKLSKLVFSIVTDPAVRSQKLKAGECQITSYPRPSEVPSLKADPKLVVQEAAGFNVGYLSYNVTHKPLDNADVRRALDMAINKPAIIKSVYQGAGQLADNAMPPTQWPFDKSLKGAAYDPDQARALLKKAGVPNGFEISLWSMPVQRPYNPDSRLMAEMIQADWAKIGVKAKIVTYEWGEYLKRAHAGEDDSLLIGSNGDNGDPDNWLGTLLGCDSVNGGNFSKWCYAPFNKLIEEGRTTADHQKRIDIYTAAQRIFADQLPFSPIGSSTIFQPMSKSVVDFKINPFGPPDFTGVSVKQ